MDYRRNVLDDNQGFTLLETIAALGLFLIITIWVTNLLLLSAKLSSGLMARQELLENARIAMDFMTTNIAMAEEITLSKRTDGTLNKLSLKETDSGGVLHTYVYQYDSSLSDNHVRYHRLEMGGNELASYLASVRVEIDVEQNTISVYIRTDDRLQPDGKKMTEPVELTGSVRIKHKKVVVL